MGDLNGKVADLIEEGKIKSTSDLIAFYREAMGEANKAAWYGTKVVDGKSVADFDKDFIVDWSKPKDIANYFREKQKGSREAQKPVKGGE